ncbi:MAG: hypothetical protein U7126_05405 [Microcoleus sp.]
MPDPKKPVPPERFVFTYNLIALGSAIYGDRLIRIKSTSKFGVWNGKQKQWMYKTKPDGSKTARLNETVYKNIMLSQLHPDTEFSICAIPTDSRVDDTELLDDYENFSLDIAGGARKHGHFVCTRKNEKTKGTVGEFYFPPEKANMGRINYGSISLSESKALFCLDNAKILVVPDLKLTNNRPDDDYDNKYSTGDAHGKINSDLLVELLDGIATDNDKVPVQFRYYQRLRQAIAVSSKNESSAISKLMKQVKEVRKDLEYRLKKSQLSEVETSQKLFSWATAYWWVAHNERPVINHALGKASFPFLLFPDIIAGQLLRERYDFSIYGFQHDEAPSILDRLPITQKTSVFLLGTYKFMDRYKSIPDNDSKNQQVFVNGAGWIALNFRTPNFFDNDGTVYAVVKDSKIFDTKGKLILDRLLEAGQYVYLRKDGSVTTMYERPHPRMKRVKEKEDTLNVKVKNGLNWINAGITSINSSSIEYGQVLECEIISHPLQKGGWSLKTVDVTVKGAKEKWYLILPLPQYPVPSPGEWKDVRLSVKEVELPPKQSKVPRVLVSCVFGTGQTPVELGVLVLNCQALTAGIATRAKLKYNPNVFKEILFSPY